MEWQWMKELQCQIDDEIKGSFEYIMTALKMKESDRVSADMYYSMAQQEMNHASTLLSMMSNKVRSDGSEQVAIVYNFLHSMIVDKMSDLTAQMTQYKS